MNQSTSDISILIASRNRCAQLQSVLQELERARAAAAGSSEVIVVDNGSSDDTPQLLRRWQDEGSGRVHLSEPRAGKSRALNRALDVARSPLLLFTDDDVRVPADWIRCSESFFSEHPEYAAAMGVVKPPPAEVDDEVSRLLACYPGIIPLFDAGDVPCDLGDMYGCNMAIRREALATVGGFNEQIGAGAIGYCEDTELSYRIRAAGMRIGYMPRAVIFHSIDRSRLTLDAFREYQIRCARSRYFMDPQQSWLRHLGRLLNDAASFLSYAWRGDEAGRVHALGRMIRHRELLRLRLLHRHNANAS